MIITKTREKGKIFDCEGEEMLETNEAECDLCKTAFENEDGHSLFHDASWLKEQLEGVWVCFNNKHYCQRCVDKVENITFEQSSGNYQSLINYMNDK